MSFDLINRNISDTFQHLLQKTGSNNEVYDLRGNQITSLAITASYAISASHETTTELSSSHADSADTTPYSGSISTRLTTNETDITNLTTKSGSWDASGSLAQNLTTKSGSWDASGSLAQNLTTKSGSWDYIIATSGSFAVTGSNVTFNHITASGNISASGTVYGGVFKITGSKGNIQTQPDNNIVFDVVANSTTGAPAVRFQQIGNGEFMSFKSKFGLQSLMIRHTANGAALYEFYGSHSADTNPSAHTANGVIHKFDDPYIENIGAFVNYTQGKRFSAFGVGTKNPTKALTVSGSVSASGHIYVNSGSGVVLTSEDGQQYKLVVANGGALTTVPFP